MLLHLHQISLDSLSKSKQNSCLFLFQVIEYLQEVKLGFEIPIHDGLPQFQSAHGVLNLAFHPEVSIRKEEGRAGGWFLVLMRSPALAERT